LDSSALDDGTDEGEELRRSIGISRLDTVAALDRAASRGYQYQPEQESIALPNIALALGRNSASQSKHGNGDGGEELGEHFESANDVDREVGSCW
jgi:hypothetical protein